MSNEYYQPGEQRAAKVNDLFAGIARRYDLLNDLQSIGLHRRWKDRLVDLAAPRPGDRVLDVCCGTGDLSWRFARRGAEVTGLDFSEPMLAVARHRRHPPSSLLHPPVFQQGDALALPFPDASFDIVSVGYGLRNLSSWERGLEEMRRVARPGARLLVLDFDQPAGALWRRLYLAHLRFAAPLLGKLFCGDAAAYAYILESLRHYPGQTGVVAKLRTLGLADVRAVPLLGGAMGLQCGRVPV
jgi:demethylmenaquinone methyltransferase/2-methoxy-6-polyprenyl-1,4-benzoquinol methylase